MGNLNIPVQRALDEFLKALDERDGVMYMVALLDGDSEVALIHLNGAILKLTYWIHGMWDYEDVIVYIVDKFNKEIEESEPIFMEQMTSDVKRIIKKVEKYF